MVAWAMCRQNHPASQRSNLLDGREGGKPVGQSTLCNDAITGMRAILSGASKNQWVVPLSTITASGRPRSAVQTIEAA